MNHDTMHVVRAPLTLVASAFLASAVLVGCGEVTSGSGASSSDTRIRSGQASELNSSDAVTKVEKVLGPHGFSVAQADSDGLRAPTDSKVDSPAAGVQLIDLKKDGETARVTFQPDNQALRAQFSQAAKRADGTEVSVQVTGYGALSCLALKDGRAVILTVIPAEGKKAVTISQPQLINDAVALVSE